MNQKYVRDVADELAIYADELRVSQTDVPYVMQPGYGRQARGSCRCTSMV